MPAEPALPIASGSPPLADSDSVLAVDPDATLLSDLLDAWVDAAPAVAAPTVEDLREGTPAEPSVPPLRVLARQEHLDDALAGFHAASRAAGLADADRLDLRVLAEPQPNAALASDDRGVALVTTDDGYLAVGDDPDLADRYADAWREASAYGLRTPSRRRVFDAFRDRCDEAVAADALRLLDAGPDPEHAPVCDARVRAYLVGARHEVLHYELRRAGEDAGLGSPSTFSKVKRRLVDAGLVDTERVDQPVGRPRQRLVPSEALAAASLAESLAVAREALADE